MTFASDVTGLVAIGVIVAIGGLLEIAGALHNRRLAERSKSWPRVAGTVLHRGTKRTFLHGIGQVPVVRYGFEVGGREWQSDQIVFGGHRAMKRGQVDKILSRYPTGSAVQVIHDPNDPSVSALEATSAFGPPLTYGVAMLVTGGIVIFAAFTGT